MTTLQAQVKRIEVGSGRLPAGGLGTNAIVERVLQTLLDNRDSPRTYPLREAVGIDVDFDFLQALRVYGRIEAMIMGGLNTGRQLGVVRPCDAKVVARLRARKYRRGRDGRSSTRTPRPSR